MSYFSQRKAGRDKSNANGQATEISGAAEAPAPGNNLHGMVSTLGPGMLITGNLICDGCTQIFGRVIGDIQAVEIIISDGARVEGNITAHDVSIHGAFKGTIRGHNVRLKGSAMIEGEVFSKSLTVEENVQFEGVSRRLDKPIELPSSVQSTGEQPVLASMAEFDSITEARP